MTDCDYIVLWNDDNYAARLRDRLGEHRIFVSESKLSEALKQEIKGIVVLAELTWEGHRFGNLYGLELAKQEIRLQNRVRAPILFVSFNEVAGIKERHGIVTAVGHDFMRLPSLPDEWQEKLARMRPLNDLQSLDIKINFCSKSGEIREIIHGVENKIRKKWQEWETDAANIEMARDELEAGLKSIAHLLADDRQHVWAIEKIKSEFDKEIVSKRPSIPARTLRKTVLSFIASVGQRLRALAPKAADETEESREGTDEARRLNWQVMLLDDDKECIAPIVKALDEKGIDCVVCENVEQAEQAIEADKYNRIVVAVCDYRLEHQESGVAWHQPKQGYEFLFELSRQDRLTGLIALSGLSRNFLLETFQKYNARVAVYAKSDMDIEEAHAINLFSTFVLDMGEEVYDALCSQPSVKGWNVLKRFYIAHRQSHDYELSEKQIGERASNFVRRIEAILSTKNLELILNPGLPMLKKLQTGMEKKDTADQKGLAIFREKLLARRIAIYLSYWRRFDSYRVFAALKGELDIQNQIDRVAKEKRKNADPENFNAADLYAESKKAMKNNVTFLINTSLALSLPELPGGILVEEKRWLADEMGIDIYGLDELLSQVNYHIKVGLEYWLSACRHLALPIMQKLNLLVEGEIVIPCFKDAKRVLRMICEELSTDEERKSFSDILSAIEVGIRSDPACKGYADQFSKFVAELEDYGSESE